MFRRIVLFRGFERKKKKVRFLTVKVLRDSCKVFQQRLVDDEGEMQGICWLMPTGSSLSGVVATGDCFTVWCLVEVQRIFGGLLVVIAWPPPRSYLFYKGWCSLSFLEVSVVVDSESLMSLPAMLSRPVDSKSLMSPFALPKTRLTRVQLDEGSPAASGVAARPPSLEICSLVIGSGQAYASRTENAVGVEFVTIGSPLMFDLAFTEAPSIYGTMLSPLVFSQPVDGPSIARSVVRSVSPLVLG